MKNNSGYEKKRNTKQKGNISLMLKYGAAALSVVSFITTMNGLNGEVVHNSFMAGLISFGIQSIILVMGLYFFKACKSIWKTTLNKAFRLFITLMLIVLYICSIGFSSFFSYVYISNKAYEDVKLSDYNNEIDSFLVTNTKELKNINEEIAKVLKAELQNEAPQMNTIINSYKKTASEETKNIIGNKKKFEVSKIPDENKFDTEMAISRYESVYGPNSINDETRESCNSFYSQINTYISFYNENHYPFYSNVYDEFINNTDTQNSKNKIKKITNKIKELKAQKNELKKFNYPNQPTINSYIKNTSNTIASYYESLIEELRDLRNSYKRIKNNSTIKTGDNFSLENINKMIYSTQIDSIVTKKSINELQGIIIAFLENKDSLSVSDNETLRSLSICLKYLGELEKYNISNNKIENFENINLNNVYVIIDKKDKESDEKISSSGSKEQIIYSKVNEESWNKKRHEDIATFINILKSMPNIEVILSNTNLNDESIEYLSKIENQGYIDKTLYKAYEYNRNKLENISNIERASNFYNSDYNFLACFCILISVFMDFASFLIGMFLYFRKK